MYAPTVRLEAAGLEPLTFGTDGIDLLAIDLGDAATREVTENAPDADGTIDTTGFTGARVITMQVHILHPTWVRRTRLRAFTSPRLRPTLITRLAADGPEVQTTVRRGPFSDPMTVEDIQADQLFITMQFVAPLGILESVDEHTAIVYAAGTGAVVGRTYPLTYPRVYPASPALGTGSIVNAGDADAYPVIRIYGPVTEPKLDNLTQDRSLIFVGLSLAAGDYIEIDTRTKTILLNSDPFNSRYNTLDFTNSRWWTLSPGVNELWLHPATFTEGVTNAQVIWRDAYQ